VIVDNGPGREDKGEPPHPDDKPNRVDVEGVVRLSLYGPKGELRGALLEEGTVVRIGAKEAAAYAKLLCPGSIIAVRGADLQTKHGRTIAAEEIGPDRHNLKPAKAPRQKHKPKHKKHDDREPTRSGASSA
jgi:hypothetical protein